MKSPDTQGLVLHDPWIRKAHPSKPSEQRADERMVEGSGGDRAGRGRLPSPVVKTSEPGEVATTQRRHVLRATRTVLRDGYATCCRAAANRTLSGHPDGEVDLFTLAGTNREGSHGSRPRSRVSRAYTG